MIMPLSKNSAGYKKIAQAFDAGENGKKWIASQLRLSGDHGASAQLKVALTIQAISDDRNGGPSGIPTLGDTITAQQSHKIAQYGEKAFPFSEKQQDAILRDANLV